MSDSGSTGLTRNRSAQRKFPVAVVGVGGGVKNERDQFQLLVLLPFPAQAEPVHHGHQDVGNDQIGRMLPRLGQSLGTVRRQFHGIAIAC